MIQITKAEMSQIGLSAIGKFLCSSARWSTHGIFLPVSDLFVDELDLSDAGFVRAAPEATGRPGYHPSVLLKRLKNVRTEIALNVLAYNLTRVMNIIGIRPLMAAIQA